jgi:hypothetical protein
MVTYTYQYPVIMQYKYRVAQNKKITITIIYVPCGCIAAIPVNFFDLRHNVGSVASVMR